MSFSTRIVSAHQILILFLYLASFTIGLESLLHDSQQAFVSRAGSQNPFGNPDPVTPSGEFSCVGKPCGRYPDEEVCSGYYICGEDKSVVQHGFCDNGLVFNDISLACDLLANVTCTGRFSCDGQKCGRYPNKDCTGYFSCDNGDSKGQVKFCTAGLKFNPTTQDCDFPDRVVCPATPACEEIHISVSTGGPCGGVSDCQGDCTKAGFKQWECQPGGCHCFCK